jgi:hypothetical protein
MFILKKAPHPNAAKLWIDHAAVRPPSSTKICPVMEAAESLAR